MAVLTVETVRNEAASLWARSARWRTLVTATAAVAAVLLMRLLLSSVSSGTSVPSGSLSGPIPATPPPGAATPAQQAQQWNAQQGVNSTDPQITAPVEPPPLKIEPKRAIREVERPVEPPKPETVPFASVPPSSGETPSIRVLQ